MKKVTLLWKHHPYSGIFTVQIDGESPVMLQLYANRIGFSGFASHDGEPVMVSSIREHRDRLRVAFATAGYEVAEDEEYR